MKIRVQLFVVMSLLIATITVLFGITIYQTRKHDILEGVDNKLLAAAQMTEHVLGRDYHDKIKGKDSISPERFVEIIRELDEICVKLGLQYLWSLMILNDEIVFTSATSTDKKVENGNHAWFFERHSNPEFYYQAFETMRPQYQQNKDKWGFIRMVLVPRQDKQGRKYLLGASVTVSKMENVLGDTIISSIYLCLFLMFLGLVTLYVVSRSISRPISRLTDTAELVAAGDLDRKIDIQGSREINVLSASLDSMRRANRDVITKLKERNTDLGRQVIERKRAEAKFTSLFNSISDIIYTHDLAGAILTVNPVAAKSLGYAPQEMIGRSLTEFMPEIYRRAFLSEYIAQLHSQGSMEGVFIVSARDGSEHFIEYRSSLMRPEGEAAYVSGSGRDVTERKDAEKEMHKLEEQLVQSQKMEAIGTLATGVAHDFNNILQIISGYLQLMQAAPEPIPSDSKYLTEMEPAVERARDLVQRLLTFGRKGDQKLQTLHLNEEVAQTVQMLRRTIPKMIRIETHLASDLKPINADNGQMYQVLMNLASNASDALGGSGLIVIETENVLLDEDYCRTHVDLNQGEYVLLRFSDDGPGMDRATMNRIFEPFFTTKGVGHGTGLGLSTVYGIVKSHSGHLSCYSEKGSGAVFSLYFPALAGADDKKALAKTNFAGAPSGGETILLVDDEPGIREVGKQMLDRKGYAVLAAGSGEAALEVYREKGGEIDLVILDLGMPGMGGQACLADILKINPQAKAIVASGYSVNGMPSGVLEAGALGFISKPYLLSEMLGKIRSVLDG